MLSKLCFKFDIRYRFYIFLIISCLFIYNLTKSNYYIKNNTRALTIASSKTKPRDSISPISFVFPTIKIDTVQTDTRNDNFSALLRNASSHLNESSYENKTDIAKNAPYCPLVPKGLRKLSVKNSFKFLQN